MAVRRSGNVDCRSETGSKEETMDPQVQALLQMMEAQSAATGAPPMYELPADVARQGAEVGFQAFNSGGIS